jgi:hypothetical protein
MRYLIVAILVAVCSGTFVWAQPAEEAARANARRSLEEGAKLFDEGDNGGALARFEEAYRYFPSPRFFYNMGQAQRRLDRPLEALESFERFLREAPDAPASARDDAARIVADLRARVGTVEVIANVAGAEVAVDGRSFGTTPRPPIRLAPGDHHIVVEKPGYEPFLHRFEVAPGASARVSADLVPRPPPAPPAVSAVRTTARAPASAESLGHKGQVGAFGRVDIAPTLPGFVIVPGLSYGLYDRFELQAAALIGRYQGAWAGGRLFLSDRALKPALSAGVPFFFRGISAWGVQGSAGVQWDPTRALGLFADVGGAFYPRASGISARAWLLTAMGVQGRY